RGLRFQVLRFEVTAPRPAPLIDIVGAASREIASCVSNLISAATRKPARRARTNARSPGTPENGDPRRMRGGVPRAAALSVAAGAGKQKYTSSTSFAHSCGAAPTPHSLPSAPTVSARTAERLDIHSGRRSDEPIVRP